MPKTGPRTADGKARASRNATRHGLLSDHPVVDPIEKPEDWDRHLQGVIDSYQPEGYVEDLLTHRIASLLWRMFRVTRYETEMLATDLDFDYEGETLALLMGKGMPTELMERRERNRERTFVAARLIPGEMTGPKIMRYESHLHRQWLQTQHELEAIQSRRRGEPTTLARLDITAPPGA
jgi:hypothetical protein